MGSIEKINLKKYYEFEIMCSSCGAQNSNDPSDWCDFYRVGKTVLCRGCAIAEGLVEATDDNYGAIE